MSASPEPTRYQAWVQASPIRGLAAAAIAITLLVLAYVFVASPFSWNVAAQISGMSVVTVLVLVTWFWIVLRATKSIAQRLPKPLSQKMRAAFAICFLVALVGGGYFLEMIVMFVTNKLGEAL